MVYRYIGQQIRVGAILITIALVVLGFDSAGAQSAGYDWLQWNGDAQHSGNNTQETRLNISNVKNLHRLFTVPLPEVVDGAPVYLSNVKTPSGTKDLLFLTTKPGHLLALDAQTGKPVWTKDHTSNTCLVDGGDPAKIPQQISCWTTSIPAVDPNRRYVYTYGLDGYVHKHQVGDGTEITGNGWPELASRKPWVDKSSPGLSIATAKSGVSYLYVTASGYPMPDPGDWGDYQGHITAINLKDGTQKVFNALCSNLTDHFVEQADTPSCPAQKAGIWGRAGVVYSPDTDRIYATAGNGSFDPPQHDWADTVFALNPDGTGINGDPLDSYTPDDFKQLEEQDRDLATAAPLILPVPPNSTVKHVAAQIGKDLKLRLLDLDNLNGHGGPGYTGGQIGSIVTLPFNAQLTNSPVMWINPSDRSAWILVPSYFGVAAYRLTTDSAGTPGLVLKWTNDKPCTSPLIANNVMYCAAFKNIWAFNPLTGAWLWGEHPIGDIHWQSPTVANGVLYIADENSELIAYAISPAA